MSPRLAVLAFAVLSCCEGFLLSGCSRKPRPEETIDGWAVARKALTNGEECFGGRPEYCITDPDFVDAAIKVRLNELYGGEMPLRKLYADAVVRAAVNEYRRAMMKPANITRVEELVKERYDNPKVTADGDEAVVDMGIVPGQIAPAPATLGLRLTRSDLVENGSWKESEARRVLSSFAKKYPDKPRVRVLATIVTSHGLETETYRYIRAERRVVVYLGDHARATPAFDGGDGAIEKLALSLDALIPCKEKGSQEGAPDCPALDAKSDPATPD